MAGLRPTGEPGVYFSGGAATGRVARAFLVKCRLGAIKGKRREQQYHSSARNVGPGGLLGGGQCDIEYSTMFNPTA
jgi:hypothetical protein